MSAAAGRLGTMNTPAADLDEQADRVRPNMVIVYGFALFEASGIRAGLGETGAAAAILACVHKKKQTVKGRIWGRIDLRDP